MLEFGSDILVRLWKNWQSNPRGITKKVLRSQILARVLTYAIPDRTKVEVLHTEGRAGGPRLWIRIDK